MMPSPFYKERLRGIFERDTWDNPQMMLGGRVGKDNTEGGIQGEGIYIARDYPVSYSNGLFYILFLLGLEFLVQ